MKNHAGDRHVLAAATAIRAELVVTFNLRHFREEHTSPLGVESIHPDDFLLILLGLNEQAVLDVLLLQASDFTNPPWELQDLLAALEASAPKFVAEIRKLAAA
jgi:hypothetical protein